MWFYVILVGANENYYTAFVLASLWPNTVGDSLFLLEPWLLILCGLTADRLSQSTQTGLCIVHQS